MPAPGGLAERVIVVGAGVVGLTCAVRLLEAGLRVDVVARDLPRETTSAVAAALWYPYRALPQDRVTAWARTSYAVFDALADTDPESGVRMVPGTEVLVVDRADPWWCSAVPALQHTRDVPAGWAAGWSFTTPVADMGVYLGWLAARVESLGGTITRLNLAALPATGLVVNCAGLGARLLGADRTVVPVRGQVVVVEQVGLERWWLDSAGPTYVVPREHDIVLGGTDIEGDWSRTPSPATAAEIVGRAAALVPQLRGARVLRHKVGLRPVRPAVRLERVGDVVHCYGHGGAGVTLSWGVADEVVSLIGR
ncbi:amino acid oxidase [Nocardioides sp. Root1257]|uniref:FAD-dependent oxidoreductase n=1 Tax=unclassified Nocardioides TaxID=2615069 RepID=UPI0006FF0F0A|nr:MULTISPECIES: FAD-dependent oxidoreductase [unclassified Nocardioides]KQW48337.1 amino acid oxidase [Nocardioides sp. Root1257]KRC47511.1 amino acid oxidase [Nocardioides sp. Root224]